MKFTKTTKLRQVIFTIISMFVSLESNPLGAGAQGRRGAGSRGRRGAGARGRRGAKAQGREGAGSRRRGGAGARDAGREGCISPAQVLRYGITLVHSLHKGFLGKSKSPTKIIGLLLNSALFKSIPILRIAIHRHSSNIASKGEESVIIDCDDVFCVFNHEANTPIHQGVSDPYFITVFAQVLFSCGQIRKIAKFHFIYPFFCALCVVYGF